MSVILIKAIFYVTAQVGHIFIASKKDLLDAEDEILFTLYGL